MQHMAVIRLNTVFKTSLLMSAVALVGCGGGSETTTTGVSVSRILPLSPVVDVLSNFEVIGTQLNRVVEVSLNGCEGMSNQTNAAARLTFRCTPTLAGDQALQLKDAEGVVLYQTQIKVTRQTVVSALTPDHATLGRLTTFQLMGASLQTGVSVSMTQCEGQTIVSATSKLLTFRCTPTALGDQRIVVKDADQRALFSRLITIQAAPTIQSMLPISTSVRLNTRFTVLGQNLPFPSNIQFPVCQELTINDQSATQIRFTCTPSDVGVHPLSILDADGSVIATQNITIHPFVTLPTKLFATGITTCATATENGLLCRAEDLGALFGLGQDGELKRGSVVRYSLVTNITPAKDTTIPDAQKCIKESITGRIWEQKTNDGGLRDKDWTYTWFNTNGYGNGGGTNPKKPEAEGSAGGATCAGVEPAKCNTDTYIATLNSEMYCGYNDWRLPVISELEHLVDFSRANNQAAISDLFQAGIQSAPYWSQNTTASHVENAWGVEYATGQSVVRPKVTAYAIRAVR
jgi:hypothetical protein